MKKTVYIDGQEGTTGLKIVQRLEKRDDLELIKIEEHLRKEVNERKKLMNQSILESIERYIFILIQR